MHSKISRQFIDFFSENGYQIMDHAPLLDPFIPMSFVMGVGSMQIENILAHSHVRKSNCFVLVQDCFRYFDLDKVGIDRSHLSFFEMPGAFVFGQVSRLEAISKIWTLMTSILKIPKNNIWASYFHGGSVLNKYIMEDAETRKAWIEVGLLKEHVVGLDVHSNFWMQSDILNSPNNTLKFGPTTELFLTEEQNGFAVRIANRVAIVEGLLNFPTQNS